MLLQPRPHSSAYPYNCFTIYLGIVIGIYQNRDNRK